MRRISCVTLFMSIAFALVWMSVPEDSTYAAKPKDASTTQPASDVISWERAGDYLDKQVTVEGTIVETKNAHKSCFLNFSRARDSFYIVVFSPALDGFTPAPSEKFLNQKIRVSGVISKHNDRLQIQVKQTTQITIVDEKDAKKK